MKAPRPIQGRNNQNAIMEMLYGELSPESEPEPIPEMAPQPSIDSVNP